MTVSKQATTDQGKLCIGLGCLITFLAFRLVMVSVLLSIHFRAIVITQSVKCLLRKLEDVSLVPNTFLCKGCAWQQVFVIPALGRDIVTCLQSH